MAKASQYLKLIDQNGEVIRGECDDGKHPDWIIVSSWDWSVTDPAALPKKGAGSGATKGGASSSLSQVRGGVVPMAKARQAMPSPLKCSDSLSRQTARPRA